MQKIGPVEKSDLLAFDTTTPQFVAISGWMPAVGFRYIQVLLYLLSKNGAFKVALAYQLATTDTSEPGSWVVLDDNVDTSLAYVSTAGGKLSSDLVDLSTAVNGSFWIRFGFASLLSTGSTPAGGAAQAMVVGLSAS